MNSQQRDAMIALVQRAHEKWPTFESMPVTDETGFVQVVDGDPHENRVYVNALYELGARGATAIGRQKGNDAAIVGRLVPASAPPVVAEKPTPVVGKPTFPPPRFTTEAAKPAKKAKAHNIY